MRVIDEHGPNGTVPLEGPAEKVLLVCSPGGHLQDLLALEPAWRDFDRTWVTTPAADVPALLRDERYRVAHGPTNRSLKMLLRNLPVAWRILREENPDVILSTGAAVAVPFFFLGKLRGKRLVYVECLARVQSVSLSGKLVYWLADTFFVQSPKAARYSRTHYVGSVL